MKKSSLLSLGISALVAANAFAGTPSKPNIIVFLVDDMGWQDTSVPFYGNEKSALNQRYKTPNMERLAKRGVNLRLSGFVALARQFDHGSERCATQS